MSAGLRVAIDARVLGQRGVGRYLSELLAALAAMDHGHRFLVALGPQSHASLVPRDARFEAVALGGHPAWAEQVGLPRLARRWGAGVLHYPDNSGALAPGLPMVLTMHDSMWRRPLSSAIAHPTWRQRLQDLYRKQVCPRAAAAARVVLTVSEHSRRDLMASLGLGPDKVRVTPNALGSAMSKPLSPSRAAAERASLGVAGPYVLCAGAADTRKNIDALIRAFAQAAQRGPLKSARLVVTSLRPGELATTGYARTAREAGLGSRVQFLGYISDGQMKALYQGALCYAFPSLWEGFGLPVLEAFAMGCPVLAADAGALPEVSGGGALLVDPTDSGSMAQGLLRLSGPAGRALSRRARPLSRRYSWRRSAQLTLMAYRDAARP